MTIPKLKPNSISLKMFSKAENVSAIAEALHALCLFVSENESFALDIQRAAVEALNNVILHAYKNQEGEEIIVHWYQENRYIYVEIIDYGTSLNLLPEVTLPDSHEENGRGWWIIKACVDEYTYKVVECIEGEKVFKIARENTYFQNVSVKSCCNILTLVKQF